jgi:hypothetical protein
MTRLDNWRHADFNPVKATSLLLMLVALVVFTSVNLRTVAGIPASNMLSVPYHSQGESMSINGDEYCGVASVQMVLQYISGKFVSQPTLATELGTDIDSGTYSNQMLNPFLHRGYTKVSVQTSDLDGLKQLNSQGYASIIAIWYDTSRKSGHYVVVTGYNETGIMVNDPWPLRWSQSSDRMSGPDAFISNSLLAILWTIESPSSQTVIIVPYPAYTSSTTAISEIVLLAELQANSLKRVGNGWD